MAKSTNKTAVEELEAAQGERMIDVKLRFWTNRIAKEDGKVLAKHAWAGWHGSRRKK
jgi:hypothetical protein